MLAIIGLAINMTGFLDMVYMDLALSLPRFDYDIVDGAETGNDTFDAYVQMRYVAGGLLGVALIWAGLARTLEGSGTGMISPGTSSRVISRSVVFVLILLVFPPLWDGGAEIIEGAALWVLNPNYTFDGQRPCPADWTESEILDRHNGSPYRRGETTDVSEAQIMCMPQFKIRYVFDQMMGSTEVYDTKQAYLSSEDPFGALTADIQNFSETVLVNTFLGLTKALVTINVLLMAFIIGIMADLLVGMIIAALPVFLMLTLVPKAEVVANRFLDALPALFMLPLLSAVVIVVGAGFIAQSGECTGEGCPEVGSILYAWISSLGVVFFAVTLPVLLVPLLGQVTQVASRVVTGAIQSAGTVAGAGAVGMAQGVKSGLRQPGGAGTLSGLGRLVGAGTAGGLLGGLGGIQKSPDAGFGFLGPSIPLSGMTSSAAKAVSGGPHSLIDRITRESAVDDVQKGLNKMGSEENARELLMQAGIGDLPRFGPDINYRQYYDDMDNMRNGEHLRKEQAAWNRYGKFPARQRRLIDATDDKSLEKLATDIKRLADSSHSVDIIKKALKDNINELAVGGP